MHAENLMFSGARKLGCGQCEWETIAHTIVFNLIMWGLCQRELDFCMFFWKSMQKWDFGVLLLLLGIRLLFWWAGLASFVMHQGSPCAIYHTLHNMVLLQILLFHVPWSQISAWSSVHRINFSGRLAPTCNLMPITTPCDGAARLEAARSWGRKRPSQ